MKSIHFVVLTLLCSLFSCNKNSEDPAEESDNTPMQLVKKTVRFEGNGQISADSTAYTYDKAGHLTATVDPKTNLPMRRFIYDGGNLIALIDYINGQADTLKNPVKLLDSGNTIFVDFTRPNPNGGADTIQLTYKWSGNQLLEAWTYLNLAGAAMPLLQKRSFSYDTGGNEYEQTILTSDGSSHLQSRGLAYDQKKNFFSNTPRLNYIFMGLDFPHSTRSVNNPIKAELPTGGQTEYIWTYNAESYPLTMQIKGKSFLALELQYNK